MEKKKTAVITFRTTEEVKTELEFRAEKFGWTVSQYVERMLTKDITNELDEAEEMAETIIELIQNKQIKSITDLTKWALKNNHFEEMILTQELWKSLIEEANNKD